MEKANELFVETNDDGDVKVSKEIVAESSVALVFVRLLLLVLLLLLLISFLLQSKKEGCKYG